MDDDVKNIIISAAENFKKIPSILLPAPKNKPYKWEPISILGILSYPEIYSKNGTYYLHINLMNGEERLIEGDKKLIEDLYADIAYWFTLT